MTKLTRRSDIAALLENVEACNPKIVGLDVCFDNEGEDYAGNDSLIDVALRHDNIVYSMKLHDWVNDTIGWTKSIHSFFYEIVDLTEGTTNMPRTLYDNMKRKVPVCELYEGKQVPSFVAQVCNGYAGQDLVKGRTKDIKINFSPIVLHGWSPEEGPDHPERREGQIVRVGAMYEETDRHWTPAGRIAGVELLGYGIHSIIYSNEIKDIPFAVLCFISFLIVFLVEVIQHWYLQSTSDASNMFVRHIIGSSYVMSILTFLFTSVLLGVSFLLFKWYGLSINLAWALSVITFLSTSRSMYSALKNFFKARAEKAASKAALAQDTEAAEHPL